MHAAETTPRARRAILLSLLLAGCAGPRATTPTAAPAARPAADAWEIIGRAASIYSRKHLRPPDRIALVTAAVLAVEADAGEEPPPIPPAGTVYEALRAALARHRVARPARSELDRATIGLDAMVRSIDRDTGYYLEAEVKGGPDPSLAAGVGVVVVASPPVPVITRVLASGPAARAGLRSGQELRSIAGVTTGGLSAAEVIERLRGPEGSQVRVGVGAPGGSTSEVMLRRALVSDRGDCRLLGGRVLYLRPGPFPRRAAEALGAFAKANDHPGGVILDLRGNRGGFLDEAAKVADLFLSEGVIYQARPAEVTPAVNAKADGSPLESVELVVLVDGETGSGAEVVAAALQDARRAAVVGVPTEGRAVIAMLFEIPGYVLKIPVAELLRGGGAPIGPGGVQPDAGPPASPAPEVGSDVACRGLASTPPLVPDPQVAAAVARLGATSRRGDPASSEPRER